MCRIWAAEGAAAPAIGGCGAAGSGLRARREQGRWARVVQPRTFRWVSPQRGRRWRAGRRSTCLGCPPSRTCSGPPTTMPAQRRSMLCRGEAALRPRGRVPACSPRRRRTVPAVMTARTIRSALAVIVAAQPDDLVSVALAHPTVWTVEQVTAAAAAAASTAPPAVLTQLVPVAVAADYCCWQHDHRRCLRRGIGAAQRK